MTPHFMQDDVEYHSDGCSRPEHPAINVKLYNFPDLDGYTERQAQSAFECTQEDFWERAKDLARLYGFSGVFSEGRSGGWMLPYHSRNIYANVADFGDRSRFLAFQRRVKKALEGVPADMLDWLKYNVDETTVT